MSGELLKFKGAVFLAELYPEASMFEFSNGWLDRIKERYGIKSYRRFGESGSVYVALIADAQPGLRVLLDQFEWKDIYNMEETGCLYEFFEPQT